LMAIVLLALGAAGNLPAAHAQDKMDQKATFAAVFDRSLSGVEKEFVSGAEAMPDDKFNFAPTQGEFKGVRSEVLVHLLENASKYSPPGTAIHVIAELRLGGEVVTSVADHGPGIEDIEQDMIFEKFYRGRSQRTSIQGTGMGLAIAKAIVELHGGTIGVRSQVGRGSVFFFTLHAD